MRLFRKTEFRKPKRVLVAQLPYSSHTDFENFIEPIFSLIPKWILDSKILFFEDRVGFKVLELHSYFDFCMMDPGSRFMEF